MDENPFQDRELVKLDLFRIGLISELIDLKKLLYKQKILQRGLELVCLESLMVD